MYPICLTSSAVASERDAARASPTSQPLAAPGAFPLSARIYDDAAYRVAGTVLPLKSLSPALPSSLSSRPAFGAGAPSEAHELFSRLCPWENTRVAPVGIVNATANCARRRRRRPRAAGGWTRRMNIIAFFHPPRLFRPCFVLDLSRAFLPTEHF